MIKVPGHGVNLMCCVGIRLAALLHAATGHRREQSTEAEQAPRNRSQPPQPQLSPSVQERRSIPLSQEPQRLSRAQQQAAAQAAARSDPDLRSAMHSIQKFCPFGDLQNDDF